MQFRESNNPSCRVYSSRHVLTDDFRRRVEAVPGIQAALVNRYHLTVDKAESYTWEEVDAGIQALETE